MSISEISTGTTDEMIAESIRLLNEDQKERGLELINQVVVNQPNHVTAFVVKAAILLATEENFEVIQTCEKIKSLTDTHTYLDDTYEIPMGLVYMLEAMAFSNMDKNDQAMDLIQTAIKINKIAPFVFIRGMLHMDNEDYIKAEKDMEFAINNPYPFKILGNDEIKQELDSMALVVMQVAKGMNVFKAFAA